MSDDAKVALNRCISSFRFTKVYGAYRYRAARAAMTSTLLRHVYDEPEAARTASDKVRKIWHRRLSTLAAADWPPLRPDKAFSYMLNCPPVGGATGKVSRTCGRWRVCPFCHARQNVLDPFRDAERVLYGCSGPTRRPDGTKVELIRPDLSVFWFRRVVPILGSTDLPVTVSTAAEHARKAAGHVARYRRLEYDLLQAEGGYALNWILPDLVKGRMTVVRCGVFLVGKDRDLLHVGDSILGVGGAAGRLPAGKKQLRDAFVSALAYDRGAAKTPGEWMVPILDASAKCLMAMTFGNMRAPSGVGEECEGGD